MFAFTRIKRWTLILYLTRTVLGLVLIMLADWRATRSPGTEIVMKSSLKSLASDNRAVTALEYGIIAGVLGLVLIAIFQNFGTTLSSLFTTIGSSI